MTIDLDDTELCDECYVERCPICGRINGALEDADDAAFVEKHTGVRLEPLPVAIKEDNANWCDRQCYLIQQPEEAHA